MSHIVLAVTDCAKMNHCGHCVQSTDNEVLLCL